MSKLDDRENIRAPLLCSWSVFWKLSGSMEFEMKSQSHIYFVEKVLLEAILTPNPGLFPFLHFNFMINLFFNSLEFLLFYAGILIIMLYNNSVVIINSEITTIRKIIPRERKKDDSETNLPFWISKRISKR